MIDKKLTPERIKQATILANKGRIIPSDDFIGAMANANRANEADFSKKKHIDARELLKPSKRGKE
jgi:hypothetical protein